MLKTCKKRWRLALVAIYCTRALLSLSKKVLDMNGSRLLRSLSYVEINMEPEDNNEKPLQFFNVDPKSLGDMVREKKLGFLSQFGGVKDLAAILETDLKKGIRDNQADLNQRKDVFGVNKFPKPPSRGLFAFVIEALNDTTMIILLLCAALSLFFGIKQHGFKNGWYDGGSIMVAIVLVVLVSALSNFKQSRQFEKLSDVSSDIRVEVVRGGRRQAASIFDVVVGDIVCLKIGDQIPADGLMMEGHSLKVDESSMSGESEPVEINVAMNPFMLSGTKVR